LEELVANIDKDAEEVVPMELILVVIPLHFLLLKKQEI
jgi:hypothetical protein